VFHYGIYINQLVNVSITTKPENEVTIDPHFVSKVCLFFANYLITFPLYSNVIIEGFGWFQWVNKS
ncbi:unnamed protein product, partial [Brassica rapa subsp. trilocularis]